MGGRQFRGLPSPRRLLGQGGRVGLHLLLGDRAGRVRHHRAAPGPRAAGRSIRVPAAGVPVRFRRAAAKLHPRSAGLAERPLAGHEPDLALARRHAGAVDAAIAALRKAAPDAGSYVSESSFFIKDWQRAFWGANYDRLLAAKLRYDPDGLFFVHHSVGTEAWSEDGFTRKA